MKNYQTPRFLWSRSLRKKANAYRRHWAQNDAAFNGGFEDRYPLTERNGRQIKRESDRRVFEANQE